MNESATNIDATLERATVALQQGRPADAAHLAREVLTVDPTHHRARYLLGVGLLGSGRGGDAVGVLETLAKEGANAAVAANFAMALAQVGRLEEAVTWLRHATSYDPGFAPAFQKLGFVLQLLDRAEEAEGPLRRAVELMPGDLEAWLTLGQILLARHDLGEARIAFSRVLAQRPGEPHATHGLAWVTIEEGAFTDAAALLRSVLACGVTDPRVRLDLGSCLQELGRWDEAVEEYRAAVAVAPELYVRALNAVVGAGRGRLWLRPSAAAKALGRRR